MVRYIMLTRTRGVFSFQAGDVAASGAIYGLPTWLGDLPTSCPVAANGESVRSVKCAFVMHRELSCFPATISLPKEESFENVGRQPMSGFSEVFTCLPLVTFCPPHGFLHENAGTCVSGSSERFGALILSRVDGSFELFLR